MNLRDIIKHVIQSRAAHPAQQGGFQDAPYRPGAPETGAGQFGRAGGVAPGMPMKPIAGLSSGMGGPVSSRNYGPEVSATPTPQPMSPPPQAMAQALRSQAAPSPMGAAPPMAQPQGGPPGAQTMPFDPASMQGTPLDGEVNNPAMQGENYLGPEAAPSGPAAGAREPSMGILPEVVVGDEGELDPETEDRAAHELGTRLGEYTDTEGMQGDELEHALMAQSQRRQQELIERFLKGQRI